MTQATVIPMKKIEARLCPRVDSPCSTPPDFARGQVSAFCSGCQKTVYNLSAMTAPEQARLLTATEPLCVRYRNLLPAAAFAMAISSAANSAESTPAPPPENKALPDVVMLTVGGAGRSLEPMFLQSELDQSLDDLAAPELDNGVEK